MSEETWWACDGTVAAAVNAAGQLIDMRGDDGRWIVTVHSPMFPGLSALVWDVGRHAVARRIYREFLGVGRDELGVEPDVAWRTIQVMRMHPSYDAAAEDIP